MMKDYKKAVEKKIQAFFSMFGLYVSRSAGGVHDRRWLRHMGIRTVIDIGASKGRFSYEFHRIFPHAQIYAFEPLPDCFALMQERMKDVPRFHAFNIALGDTPGTVTMQRSSYSGSSSLRQMADLHKNLFPITAGQKPLVVAVDTLDHALSGYDLEEDIMVKMDVQGFEDKVLAGAVQTLQRVKLIIIEMSFKELYIGQPLFGDIYRLLTEQGFAYQGAWDPDFRSPQDGSSLQQDAVFIRA